MSFISEKNMQLNYFQSILQVKVHRCYNFGHVQSLTFVGFVSFLVKLKLAFG